MSALLYTSILLFLACSGTVNGKTTDKVQCRDENNNPVDWFVVYKLPKSAQSANPLIRQGLAYLYITNVTASIGWQLSAKAISASNSTPGNTLAPIYDDKNSAKKLWVLYNDQPPHTSSNAKYGHTKGALIGGEDQGLWLIHSVPNFPPYPNGGERKKSRTNNDGTTTPPPNTDGKYNYPESASIFGQNFLCISFRSDQFDIVGEQFMYNQIIAYSKNLPESLSKQHPVLTDAINQKRIKSPPYNHKALLTSLGSTEFTSFAKSDKWQKDLYDDFVATQLNSNLYVQSWLNGRGRLPTDCVGKKVYNILSVDLDVASLDFQSSRDHSKWAVTIANKGDNNWICVGDVNRADTQYYRGGGAVCFKNSNVWKNYRNAVNDVEPCPRS